MSEHLIYANPSVQLSPNWRPPLLWAWNGTSQRAAHFGKFSSESGCFSHHVLKGKDTGDWKITALFMTEDVKAFTKCQGKPFAVQPHGLWGPTFHCVPGKSASYEQKLTLMVFFFLSVLELLIHSCPTGSWLTSVEWVSWAPCRATAHVSAPSDGGKQDASAGAPEHYAPSPSSEAARKWAKGRTTVSAK